MLIGYLNGVAVVMIVGQLGKLLGLSISAETPPGQVIEVVREIGQVSWATFAVGAACLALLLLGRWLVPQAARRADRRGPRHRGVRRPRPGRGTEWRWSGEIPAGLPSISLPDLQLRAILDLVPAALGIFFVSFSDEILVARSFAGRHGQHIRADAELAAMGAASLAASISQGMPVGASGSRTAVNDQMGGRTQVSGLLAAGVVALVLLFLTAPMQYLPKATLGAVIVAASIGLIDPAAWRGLARVSKVEVVIAAITMIGVIAVGVLPALCWRSPWRSSTPSGEAPPPTTRCWAGWNASTATRTSGCIPRRQVVPGVLVYRLDDRLFFANANYVQARIREAVAGAPTPVHWLVFDAEGLSHVDATGIELLTELIESLRKKSITFVFARLKSPMVENLREAGVLEPRRRRTRLPDGARGRR